MADDDDDLGEDQGDGGDEVAASPVGAVGTDPDVWNRLIDDMVLRSARPGMPPIGSGTGAGYDPWNDLVGHYTDPPMKIDDLVMWQANNGSGPFAATPVSSPYGADAGPDSVPPTPFDPGQTATAPISFWTDPRFDPNGGASSGAGATSFPDRAEAPEPPAADLAPAVTPFQPFNPGSLTNTTPTFWLDPRLGASDDSLSGDPGDDQLLGGTGADSVVGTDGKSALPPDAHAAGLRGSIGLPNIGDASPTSKAAGLRGPMSVPEQRENFGDSLKEEARDPATLTGLGSDALKNVAKWAPPGIPVRGAPNGNLHIERITTPPPASAGPLLYDAARRLKKINIGLDILKIVQARDKGHATAEVLGDYVGSLPGALVTEPLTAGGVAAGEALFPPGGGILGGAASFLAGAGLQIAGGAYGSKRAGKAYDQIVHSGAPPRGSR